jgi:Ni,Fe-hydrogenase III large subunit
MTATAERLRRLADGMVRVDAWRPWRSGEIRVAAELIRTAADHIEQLQAQIQHQGDVYEAGYTAGRSDAWAEHERWMHRP